MNSLIILALKDLRLLWRDKVNVFWVLGFPLIMALFFGSIFSGGGGSGVAVANASGERTYMKMGTGGIGFGIGAQKYSVVFFFEDQQHFTNFLEKGWQADTGAQAAAGDAGANAAATFRNGTAVFQITEKGLMASADVSGTKYSKNDKLNK